MSETAKDADLRAMIAPPEQLSEFFHNVNRLIPYLASIECNHGVEVRCLEPSLLRADDFNVFMRDRARELLDLVEWAIGKTVVGRDAEDVVAAFGAPLLAHQNGEKGTGE